MSAGSPVLEVQDVTKSFGSVRAVNHVTFAVQPGQLFAVIGPNGAGKTTLLNVISGIIWPDAGLVRVSGRDLTRAGTARHVANGLARTLQAPVVFPGLTVLENVALGHISNRNVSFTAALFGLPPVRRWEREAREKAKQLVALLGLDEVVDRDASKLPLGYQRLVEIGRALATEPKIVLLDEPAAGLSEGETERLAALLRSTCDRGIAVCLVEHNMRLVMNVAERILVLQQGEPLFEGSPEEVQSHPDVIAAYLGGTRVEAVPRAGG